MEEEEGILHKSCPIGNGGSRPPIIAKHCGVEQLVARRAHNPEVGGSSPPPATKNEFIETGLNLWSESVPDGRCLIW